MKKKRRREEEEGDEEMEKRRRRMSGITVPNCMPVQDISAISTKTERN